MTQDERKRACGTDLDRTGSRRADMAVSAVRAHLAALSGEH